MSINLTLHDGDTVGVDLWQTPTHITWMCLSYSPGSSEPDGGHEGVRRRYIEWIKSHANGTWKDRTKLELITKRVKDHVNKVMSVKSPYFSFI